jgi:hypothetical protein
LDQQVFFWKSYFRRKFGKYPIDKSQTLGMKYLLTIALGLCLNIYLIGQVTILDEDFRAGSLPAGWTANLITFTTSADGYARFDNQMTSELISPVVDLTGYSNVTLTFDVAKFGSGGDGPITVEVSDDGGATWTAQTFDSPIPLNGTNYVTSGPTTITATGPNVRFRFTRINSGSQKRFRDVVLQGTIGSSGTVGFVSTAGIGNEAPFAQQFDIQVESQNFSSNFSLDVNVTGGTAEPGDYNLTTTSLDFTGNQTQNVTIFILNDLDEDDETIEITLTESTSTGVVITSAVFTLTILDDDGAVLLISQYVETNSGNSPKGIEIWNNSTVEADFSVKELEVNQYTNGGSNPDNIITISSGTLEPNEVLVIGTSDLGTYLSNNAPTVQIFSYSFQFNGNDALELVYGGNQVDVFGTIGVDPGSAWSGSGVSTANQNIALLGSVNSGSPGFTDPSTRFSTISNDPIGTGGLTGFGIAPGAPLPVDLVSFEVQKEGQKAKISWQTATEIENDYFLLERAGRDLIFEVIAKVYGKGNSSGISYYAIQDNEPVSGINYYRLSQVDLDGSQRGFPVKVLDFQKGTSEILLYPTIVEQVINLEIPENIEEKVSLQIYDLNGRVLKKAVHDAGSMIQWDVKELQSGYYFIKINTPKISESLRFFKS